MKELYSESAAFTLQSVLAGMSVSLGCIAYMMSESKVLGALLFSIGLFVICSRNLYLYTGKICLLFQLKRNYRIALVLIWIFNFVGAYLMAMIILKTRLSVSLQMAAINIVYTKSQDTLLSLFFLGILCGICIFISTASYTLTDRNTAIIGLIFGVVIFVFCGFEHCIADMFYITIAHMWTWDMFLRVLIITLGNSVGGLIFPFLEKIILKK